MSENPLLRRDDRMFSPVYVISIAPCAKTPKEEGAVLPFIN
jgi:hypothetical protein